MSGAHTWTGFGASNMMIVTPQKRFLPGEQVTVALAPGLQGFNGAALANGYCWNFVVSAPHGSGTFSQSTTLADAAAANEFVVAGDFDGDGLADAIVTVFFRSPSSLLPQ